MNLTFVTCIYYDLFETEFGGRPHPKNKYFYGIESALKTNSPFVIFVWPKNIEETKNHFIDFLGEDEFNNRIKVIGFDLYATEYREIIKKEKETGSGQRYAGDRSPDVCISKFGMLKQVAEDNYFNTESFFWIDAGLSSSSLFPDKYLDLDSRDRRWSSCSLFTPNVAENLYKKLDDRVLLIKNNSLGWGFKAGHISYDDEAYYYIIGGLFGGMKESVITFCTQIMNSFYFYVNDEEMLYMDEELLTLLYFNNKESFNTLEFDVWHHEDSGEWVQELIIGKKNFYTLFEELNNQ
jgi:hypothetical protein